MGPTPNGGRPSPISSRPTRTPQLLRTALREFDSALSISAVQPLDRVLGGALAHHRFSMLMVVVFGTLALLITAAGLYGVIGFIVSQRTREIGIRMALGAERRDIRRMVFSHAFAPALWGIPVGIGLAVWAAQFARAFLHDVSPSDPWTFVAVSALLATLALAATWLPARRAARLDPVTALRDQ